MYIFFIYCYKIVKIIMYTKFCLKSTYVYNMYIMLEIISMKIITPCVNKIIMRLKDTTY